ncbi:uridine kinase [Ruminococcus sp. XPD3002]|uniref:uridine kinase family protein n=1 Tax=Ruminococcus sp. XPD3002 TaxID=1452269 RepID=UPI0009205F17|nr:uridine kinase [Ruminococcus flavefaciens]
MNIEINRINANIEKDPSGFVKNINEEYLFQLERIADDIAAHRDERPVILLSGPSGSGKTTTAFMIEKLLDEKGCTTHTLSMDNYFKPLTEEEKKLAAEGRMDLESPLRVDADLLNSQIESIERGEPTEIPHYNFAESKRGKSKLTLERKKGELVIFEGIHALNPDVITVPDEQLCKLYVSVRTRITCDDIILHPSKVRLLRRMIRDNNFRKRSLRETMNMFHSVEQGENKYIMPYKHRSDYDIDTFIGYELSAYRDSLLGQLKEMEDSELADVTKVLENTEPIDKRFITPDSLVCEFIGHGQFKY